MVLTALNIIVLNFRKQKAHLNPVSIKRTQVDIDEGLPVPGRLLTVDNKMDWTKNTPSEPPVFSQDTRLQMFSVSGVASIIFFTVVCCSSGWHPMLIYLRSSSGKAGSVLGVEPDSGENRAPSAIYTEHHRSSFLPVRQTLRALISIS